MYCNFLIRPCKPKWIERNKYETLSRCSKNFERDTYKGGRGVLAPRPPLQVFSLTNCSDSCLSLVFFPFNPFWLAGANQKITFWGPWTYFKIIYIFDFDLNISIFVSFIPQSPSGGKNPRKTGTCESKVACKFLKKSPRRL